jgi:Arc/MetJ-type ribon-helix-helix transcriptional regulator
MSQKWKTVNIPAEMHNHILELIEKPTIKEKYAFSSPSEFVRRALSDAIEKIEKELKK